MENKLHIVRLYNEINGIDNIRANLIKPYLNKADTLLQEMITAMVHEDDKLYNNKRDDWMLTFADLRNVLLKYNLFEKNRSLQLVVKSLLDFGELNFLDTDCNALKIEQILTIEERIVSGFLGFCLTDKYLNNIWSPMTIPDKNTILTDDSLSLTVIPAFYDSTIAPNIRYWVDDSIRSNNGMIQQSYNTINLSGNKGFHTVYGDIRVKTVNGFEWKPWKFEYEAK